MAKLLYVGPNLQNKKGLSSKAYTIRRKGRVVHIGYGSVEALGGGGSKIRWLGSFPRTQRKKFSSAKEAQT